MTGNPLPNNAGVNFDAKANLQRDQIAKIVLITHKLFDEKQDYCLNKIPFPDVAKIAWSFQYICRGVSVVVNGSAMITGYQSGVDKGFYRPARFVTIPEFYALLLRPLSDKMPSNDSVSFPGLQSGLWFSGFAKYVKDNNLDTSFDVNANVMRIKVAQVIFKLHKLGKI